MAWCVCEAAPFCVCRYACAEKHTRYVWFAFRVNSVGLCVLKTTLLRPLSGFSASGWEGGHMQILLCTCLVCWPAFSQWSPVVLIKKKKSPIALLLCRNGIDWQLLLTLVTRVTHGSHVSKAGRSNDQNQSLNHRNTVARLQCYYSTVICGIIQGNMCMFFCFFSFCVLLSVWSCLQNLGTKVGCGCFLLWSE